MLHPTTTAAIVATLLFVFVFVFVFPHSFLSPVGVALLLPTPTLYQILRYSISSSPTAYFCFMQVTVVPQ